VHAPKWKKLLYLPWPLNTGVPEFTNRTSLFVFYFFNYYPMYYLFLHLIAFGIFPTSVLHFSWPFLRLNKPEPTSSPAASNMRRIFSKRRSEVSRPASTAFFSMYVQRNFILQLTFRLGRLFVLCKPCCSRFSASVFGFPSRTPMNSVTSCISRSGGICLVVFPTFHCSQQ
jgi:hypothetical protein